ncbi:MAG: type I DNA topoisomerase [Bacteroidota bacterium]
MSKNLVIVESPAKAKTIEGFLGKDYTVKSSFGHVRDLAKKTISIDIENNFEPHYEISDDKKKIITELKKLAIESEVVWLASDEDREGEAISWHLAETLNLDEAKTRRIVFHEITKNAILEAINNPRKIDKNLVDAQQARRILDRLVGFELSPVLWRKVKPALSAGRVQSVAVRLIVDRERDVINFNTETFYRLVGNFIATVNNDKVSLKAELDKKFSTKEQAIAFLEKCKKSDFAVKEIETKPTKKSPAPPFTTSTLQQEASRKLGFSVSKTMTIAQQLYESGKITYMRTDSVNLSDLAIDLAKKEISASYGEGYLKVRKYTTKTKGAQEAHEAIRPTYMNNHTVDGDVAQKKLYELIWKRTIASQMSDALMEKTNISINLSASKELFVATGEVLKFDGFLKVYLESTDDEEEEDHGLLPALTKNQKLDYDKIESIQRFTQHPARYTEASLVKKLEELGIGRPSTYAPIISTIQKRGYVVNETKEGVERNYDYIVLSANKIAEKIKTEKTGYEKYKLFPTDIGIVVNDFLVENFNEILDFNFTASVEKEFDEIAQGDIVWNEMIKNFYGKFHDKVKDTDKNAKKASGEKLLGIDPKTGKNVYAKIGKYGPIVQIGEIDDEEKPQFAGLLKDQSLGTITLDGALELFKFPRSIGEYEGKEMVVSVGKFGPYIRHDSKFYSIPKDESPLQILSERAIEIIELKRKVEKEKLILDFDDIKVLNGRWGAYINQGKENFKIPKGTEPTSLTKDICLDIIKKGGEEGKGTKKKFFKKKSA